MDIFKRKNYCFITYFIVSVVLLSCTEKDSIVGTSPQSDETAKNSIINYKVSEE